jgi:protein tyrosine/serine phosphatase
MTTSTLAAPRGGPAPDWGINYGIDSLWSEIIPGILFMGGTSDNDWIDQPRQSLQDANGKTMSIGEAQVTKDDIDAVVTLFEYAHPVGHKVRELRVGIHDSENGAFDEEELHEMVDWALTHVRAGHRVLVRCQAGLNRSGLITGLILIALGMKPGEAITAIRNKRSQRALFNMDFVGYLLDQKTEDWA